MPGVTRHRPLIQLRRNASSPERDAASALLTDEALTPSLRPQAGMVHHDQAHPGRWLGVDDEALRFPLRIDRGGMTHSL